MSTSYISETPQEGGGVGTETKNIPSLREMAITMGVRKSLVAYISERLEDPNPRRSCEVSYNPEPPSPAMLELALKLSCVATFGLEQKLEDALGDVGDFYFLDDPHFDSSIDTEVTNTAYINMQKRRLEQGQSNLQDNLERLNKLKERIGAAIQVLDKFYQKAVKAGTFSLDYGHESVTTIGFDGGKGVVLQRAGVRPERPLEFMDNFTPPDGKIFARITASSGDVPWSYSDAFEPLQPRDEKIQNMGEVFIATLRELDNLAKRVFRANSQADLVMADITKNIKYLDGLIAGSQDFSK